MVWALSEPGKTTPKAGLTLLSREDGNLKFVHSPSASGDVSLKHKLGQKLTLGVGFTDATVRKVRSLPGLVLSGDLKVNKDITLSAAHNLASKALKAGITYNTVIGGKKTAIKGSYLTKGGVFTGEVASLLAPNKRTIVAFNDKQVTNLKLVLADGPFTYEPSYNLVKKAPSLAVSRPTGPGKCKFTWNLKTDDLGIEYAMRGVRLLVAKRPSEPVPLVGVSYEADFTF